MNYVVLGGVFDDKEPRIETVTVLWRKENVASVDLSGRTIYVGPQDLREDPHKAFEEAWARNRAKRKALEAQIDAIETRQDKLLEWLDAATQEEKEAK